MAEEQNSQAVEKSAESAPVEPSIDSLLPSIPDLAQLFTEEPPKTGQPEQKPDSAAPAPEPGATETALEDVIPEGLKPDEKPPEPEPKKEDLSDSVQKRIDKLTAQKKTAEERAAALETELSDLKSKYHAPAPLLPTAASPLADIENEQDLAAKINHIQEAKTWCIQHLDGGEADDGKGNKQWLDGNTVKAILANAEIMLSKHVPERRDFIASKKHFDAEARREYPALFKEGSEAKKTHDQWQTLFPECRRFPDMTLIIGDALVGQQIRLNRAKARNGKSPPGNQSQPLAPPAPAASPRVPQNKALSGQQLAEAFTADPNAALNSFVDQLIEGGTAQRAAKR
jgi:hypothetical protein